MITVNFKKVHPNAVTPQMATDYSVAFDVTATTIEIEYDNTHTPTVTVGLGIAAEVPLGYHLKLYARSSLSNTNWVLGNSVGVIDTDYRGELKMKFKYIGNEPTYQEKFPYNIGDRCGQLEIGRSISGEFVEVDTLQETKRGEGGFGSTGK